MARESWSDQRLDDMNHRIDSGFSEVSREFQAVRLEMRAEFAAVRSEMTTEFAAVRAEINSMRGEMRDEMRGIREETAGIRAEMGAGRRAMLQLAGCMLAAYVVGFLGVIATILTQV